MSMGDFMFLPSYLCKCWYTHLFYWANFCYLTTQKRASAIHMKVFLEKKVPKLPNFEEFFFKSSYLNNRFQQIAKI